MLHLEDEYRTIEQLKEDNEWPNEFISTFGLVPYIKRSKDNLIYVEVGTGKGEGIFYLKEQCSNIKEFYSYDPYIAYQDWNGFQDQEHMNKIEEVMNKNLNNVFIHQFKNFEAIKNIKNINILYIDADNTYQTTFSMLKELVPNVVKKGIISIHNARMENVTKAIIDFRKESKQNSEIYCVQNNTWFWYKH